MARKINIVRDDEDAVMRGTLKSGLKKFNRSGFRDEPR